MRCVSQDESGTASRRTPFCASSSKRHRAAAALAKVKNSRGPIATGSVVPFKFLESDADWVTAEEEINFASVFIHMPLFMRHWGATRLLSSSRKLPSWPRSVACSVVLSFRRHYNVGGRQWGSILINLVSTGKYVDWTSESRHSKAGNMGLRFRAPARSDSNHRRLENARRKVREPPTAATNF